MTNKEICFAKMQDCKILFTYRQKNRKIKQIYTVITDKEVLIGGMGEKGYMLRIYPENTDSNMCMTYNDILRVLSGKIISQQDYSVQLIK